MDKLNHYRDLIKRILTQYHQLAAQTPSSGLESLLAFDETRNQYLWFQTIPLSFKHSTQKPLLAAQDSLD
ncbi:element excision factor XisI family protein [Coleofasciculus sp.]|uniref:element excision factor XisI family protein n=1 Tax=Coleofasciculus sp. TaxID=3100458 RepID=UPI0039F82E51